MPKPKPQTTWQEIEEALNEMTDGDSLDGWDLPAIKGLFNQIRKHMEKKELNHGSKKEGA